ncbi:DNA polymerase III subunit delta' [Gleimia hominis]|uniref:DNA polymerase III subunit delta' n=1 Tax=Gleimia hominis TaxID=595468 RepID=UPI000C803E51|nr:DNA polymerase III subunit delta' [Gleimia hominis]WIK64377.1 DNA polymerase III subunit delta' [Gleimia hominis]
MTVWDELVGQEHAVSILRNAATQARAIVGQERGGDPKSGGQGMTHSWLITGPPGSGRSTVARAFAAALQCTGPTVGCGQCAGCRTTMLKSHSDVTDLDTSTVIITIDQVRELIREAQTAPALGRWRVVLVEDADRMLERTSNVLLKSIEEPPERTVWILCAPSPEDLIVTIRSRCRHVQLQVPSVHAVSDLLVKRGVDPQQARLCAQLSQGHVGRAQGLADDPNQVEERRELLSLAVRARSVGQAVLNADTLLEQVKTQAGAEIDAADEREIQALKRTLGVDGEKRLDPSTRAQIKTVEDQQKRRRDRRQRDAIDRVMVDLLGLLRDVLITQLGAGMDLINVDLSNQVESMAGRTDASRTLARMNAIDRARERMAANVPPLLVLESLLVSLI